MPNLCVSNLVIEGEKAELERFCAATTAGGRALAFAPLMPPPGPDSVNRSLRGDLTPEQLEWQLEHWGTRWGPYGEIALTRLPDSLVYRFATPWSAPTGWLKFVALQFPKLSMSLDYREPGGGFGGRLVLQGGTIVEEAEFDIEAEDDEE